MILAEIRDECANPYIKAKEFYRVRFTDKDTGFHAAVWIDREARKVECAFKKGEVADIIENCTSHYEAKCYGQHIYWFDSCGYKEEKKEYCEHGCEDGRCFKFEHCFNNVKDEDETNVDCGGIECQPCEVCVDSDNGKNYFEEGEVKKGGTSHKDYCNIDGTLTEKYCENNEIKAEKIHCSQGYECINGECRSENCTSHFGYICHNGHLYWVDSCENIEEKKEYCKYGCGRGICVGECKDSDGGDNIYEKGTCYDESNTQGITDVCEEDPYYSTVKDYSCREGECVGKYKYCIYGCEDGACKESGVGCTDSDEGINENVSGYVSWEGTTYPDYCKDELPYDTLIEYYCDGNDLKSKEIYCGHLNCAYGKCLQRECYLHFNEAGCQQSVTVDGEEYVFDLKGYEAESEKAYFYINSAPTTPYGWDSSSIYYIQNTDIYALLYDFHMLSYNDTQTNTTVQYPSVTITLNKECIKECGKACHGRLHPQENIECCEGLDKIYEIADAETIENGKACILGFGEYCISCGDGICDGRSENRCNCPEDCDTGCTILFYNIDTDMHSSYQLERSVMIDGSMYEFTYKGFDENGTLYLYINEQPASPYGWILGETYTIPETSIDVKYRVISSFPASWNETLLPDFFSAELYIDEECTHL